LMMLPIALSVARLAPDDGPGGEGRGFMTALLLAVAYGATTGGVATLIGTPPNALLAGFVSDTYGIEIGFGRWMLVGVPVMLVALPLIHVVLTRVSFRVGGEELPGLRELLAEEKAKQGRFSRGEWVVAVVFGLTALAWITQPLLAKAIPALSDTVIAMAGALVLFVIPVEPSKGRFAMDWETARGVPWDVLLLFGGGLSLAAAIQKSGLALYLGGLFEGLGGMPAIAVVAITCLGILLLTELTSNTATAATFLPVAAAVAVSLGQNPLFLLAPVAMAASCAYMLPVGTPPNAIVFGSGCVTLPQMVRAGLWLNLLLVPVIVAAVLLLGGLAFGVEFGVLPDWAK